MSQFFESIKLLDGNIPLLHLHQKRIERTVNDNFRTKCKLDLEKELSKVRLASQGLFKIKVIYDSHLHQISVEPYQIKTHSKIAILKKENIAYPYKSSSRNQFDFNTQLSDDAIFVSHNSLTDASYSNLALFDGEQWYTPEKCLLKGVKREHLLKNKQIKTRDIKLADLEHYSKIAFINAMRDFEKIYTFVKEDHFLLLTACK
jgi:4-amino-4-deoxychorismate lyase